MNWYEREGEVEERANMLSRNKASEALPEVTIHRNVRLHVMMHLEENISQRRCLN